MREDVKDLLDRAAGWYEPPPLEPEHLARRHRAQQRRARIAAAAMAMLVFVAAGTLTWSAFRPSGSVGPGGPQPGTDVTATVNGVSLTYPRSWTLVDLWPVASSIASWPEPVGSSISVPEGTPERGGLPLLQLSNHDLGLRSLCGTELTGEEAVLYVALNGGPYRVNPDGSPIWSHRLSYDEGPCGDGWYAYKASDEPGAGGTTLSAPYLVFAGFGPEVRQVDRAAMFGAFDSLRLAPFDHLRPPAETLPRYLAPGSQREGTGVEVVLGRGAVSGQAWTLVAYGSGDGLCVDLRLASGSSGGCGFDVSKTRELGLSVGSQADLSKTIIHGVLSKRVATLVVILDGDERVDVPIIEGPSGFDVNFFAAFLSPDAEGIVEARDDQGAVLQRERLTPLSEYRDQLANAFTEEVLDDFKLALYYPEGWNRASEVLTPELDQPMELLSLGTRDLIPGGDDCAQIPERAIESLGPADALITLQEASAPAGFPPRPKSFSSEDGEMAESAACLENADAISFWTLRFEESDRSFIAYVAIADSASGHTRDEVWQILNALIVCDPASPSGDCL